MSVFTNSVGLYQCSLQLKLSTPSKQYSWLWVKAFLFKFVLGHNRKGLGAPSRQVTGKVKKTDYCPVAGLIGGCWLWTGPLYDGYGRLATQRGKTHWCPPIPVTSLPTGRFQTVLCLTICVRVRSCVNPDHMEAVTHRESVLRGISQYLGMP